MTRLLRNETSIPREDDGAVRFDDILEEFKARFKDSLQWPIEDWTTIQAKGGGQKNRFQYCLNPDSSDNFLYFRAIQGHSGRNVVDPSLQDNVLLPEHFTEYIHHIRNAIELYSMIRSGLIPGGKSLKRDRQSVFFTALNPMEHDQGIEETRCNLDEPRIVPHKNTWRSHQKHSVLVQFETRSRDRIVILSNKITCNRSPPYISCDLYGESSMHEVWRCIIQQSISVAKVPSSCIETEFAKWTAGSTSPRSKKILRPPKRIRQYRGNRKQHRLPIYNPTTGHESQRNGQKVVPAIRESPQQGVLIERFDDDRRT